MAAELTIVETDAQVIIARVLARYTAATVSAANPTGTVLAAADPRRLHLLALLQEIIHLRSLIDFAGKQSLIGYVSALWINALAELWREAPLVAKPSFCTERFHAATPSTVLTLTAGIRVTDGVNTWEVLAEDVPNPAAGHVDAKVTCIVDGGASNAITAGQIATLVDSVPGCSTVENITETDGGRDVETVEAFRERLRDVPESSSTAGPRVAYRALALAASSTVADAAVIGPQDGGSLAGSTPAPGHVKILVIEGTRAADGTLLTINPDPADYLLADVLEACSLETVRPLTDYVEADAPLFVDFEIAGTYFIAKSRIKQASQIVVAVEAAVAAYALAQQAQIGLDINPDALIQAVREAGAKRIALSFPTFVKVYRDQSARLVYENLVYGGVEDD